MLPLSASTESAPAWMRGGEHALAEEQGVERDRGRGLRAVDQREAFLGGKDERVAAHALERLRGGHDVAGEVDAAFAHQRGDHVRERGEVARGADAALRRDDRHGVGVEQMLERVDDGAADPAVAAAEADQLEQDHHADGVARERVAEAAAVAEDQVALELAKLVGGDAGLGEQAEAGVDAVDGLAAGDDAVDRGGGGVDRGE